MKVMWTLNTKEKQMENRKVRLGMSVMVLTFALVVAACGSGPNPLTLLFGGTSSPGTSEFQTRRNNDGNLVIVQYRGRGGEVIIPAEFEGIPVVEIGEKAFSGATSVKSLILPEGLTVIETDAFDGCTGLISISIPASIIRIGKTGNDSEDSFDGCTGLTNIMVAGGNGVYSTENGVLFNKDKTALLLYPEGKSGIYTIPSTVTDIVYCAFEGCAKLTGVTIPDSVASIGELAFRDCTGLTSITIPASVKTITGDNRNDTGYGAFFRCTGLKTVIISEGVTAIGATAFYRCTGLASITIPDSVTSIGELAFAYCTGLTSITIPASVKTITGDDRNDTGYGVFLGCTGLKTVIISEGVTAIGATAFYQCTGLASITIPDSVTSIGNRAFYGCSSLVSVTIPDSVTYIGGNAFATCTSLISVTISPVEGRKWDLTGPKNGERYYIFHSCPLNNAARVAIRNAGYPGEEI
jgi:hypothetical protein